MSEPARLNRQETDDIPGRLGSVSGPSRSTASGRSGSMLGPIVNSLSILSAGRCGQQVAVYGEGCEIEFEWSCLFLFPLNARDGHGRTGRVDHRVDGIVSTDHTRHPCPRGLLGGHRRSLQKHPFTGRLSHGKIIENDARGVRTLQVEFGGADRQTEVIFVPNMRIEGVERESDRVLFNGRRRDAPRVYESASHLEGDAARPVRHRCPRIDRAYARDDPKVEPRRRPESVMDLIVDQVRETAHGTTLRGGLEEAFAEITILRVGQFVRQSRERFEHHHARVGFQTVLPPRMPRCGEINQRLPIAAPVARAVIDRWIVEILGRAFVLRRFAVERTGAIRLEAEGDSVEVDIDAGIVDEQLIERKVTWLIDLSRSTSDRRTRPKRPRH